MKRRTLLATMAGITGAGSLPFATGAFSFVRADRDLRATVVRDDDAYLRLTVSDDNFAYPDGDGQLAFEFDGDFRDYAGGTETGDGLGQDSVYEFAGLFNVENRGTRDVRVFGEYDDPDGVNAVELFDSHDPDRSPLTPDDPSKSLAPGDILKVGMRIDTHGIDVDGYETTITIGAKREE